MQAVVKIQVINGADIRMIEGGSESRFTFEALQIYIADCERSREYLDDDGAVEFGINGFVYLALSANAKFRNDAVVVKALANYHRSADFQMDLALLHQEQ